MSCGGSMKKMAIGGTTTKRIIKKSTGGMYGIPQENMGTSGQYGFGQKGGTVKKPLKKTRIIDSKIPMKGQGAPVYKPLLAKKGGAVKMPNGKVMLNSKMQNGGTTNSIRKNARTDGGNRTRSSAEMAALKGMKRVDDAIERILPSVAKSSTYKKTKAAIKNKADINMHGYKKGGATKAAKFAALAPPYNKATFADRIVGAKKNAKKKK
jgi:hypothetical protein